MYYLVLPPSTRGLYWGGGYFAWQSYVDWQNFTEVELLPIDHHRSSISEDQKEDETTIKATEATPMQQSIQ